jgi:hypothetical protein
MAPSAHEVVATTHAHSVHGKAWSTLGRYLDPITQDACAFYRMQIGSSVAGPGELQPLWERIVREQPDLLNRRAPAGLRGLRLMFLQSTSHPIKSSRFSSLPAYSHVWMPKPVGAWYLRFGQARPGIKPRTSWSAKRRTFPMINRALLGVGGLWCLASVGCSNGAGDADGGMAAADASGGDGSSGGTPGAMSLIGTWDLMTTPMGSTGSLTTTVTIGQNSLMVTSHDFILTATRTGNTLSFTDEQSVRDPSNNVVLTATQNAATFNAGILPFDLGGNWTMQIGPPGQSAVETCTLTMSSTEIDGACSIVSGPLIDFSFSTSKMTSAASSLGDFGGTWMNTWTKPGASGGTYPCLLTFTGNTITTCAGGAANDVKGTPLSGITFTYDGADRVSGVAQGWAEYSATRR